MLLPVSDICLWLRQSAITLRAGGSEASAVVYEEIADRLDNESGVMREAYRAEIAKSREKIVGSALFGPAVIELIDEHGLSVVPRRWVE